MNNMPLETIKIDVLVAGSGGAGFRAAVGALEKGASVLLVSKGRLARSGASPMAGADLTCHGQGMRAAGFFGEPRDSVDKFFSDIVHHGSFLNDQSLTRCYVEDGPERMKEMLDWGLDVIFTDERAVFTPGTSIVDAVYRQGRKLGLQTLEDVALLDLYTRDGKVTGALGLNFKTGQFYRIYAKAVILATGGWHKAFKVVTGSRELTGDGTAMALRAGAKLSDMEFITFACNVVYAPEKYRGSIFTYVLSLMAGGETENSEGERIYKKYNPWMISYANKTEWNKSFISFITGKEIRAGKALPNGGVRYVLGEQTFEEYNALVEKYYPDWVFHDASFDQLRESMRSGEGVEVGPGAEYFEGGIAVNEKYETSLPGLYAAGECASSVFGANRVAAATMEMLTTGARAGWSAGEYTINQTHADIDKNQEEKILLRVLAPLQRKTGQSPIKLRKEFQERTHFEMGPVRDEAVLGNYLKYLDDLQGNLFAQIAVQNKSGVYNKEWIEALDLENMVLTMQACALAAKERKESRGVHYREDYPQVNNVDWLKQILIAKDQDQLTVSTKPVNTGFLQPAQGKFDYLDFIKDMMQAHSDVGGHH